VKALSITGLKVSARPPSPETWKRLSSLVRVHLRVLLCNVQSRCLAPPDCRAATGPRVWQLLHISTQNREPPTLQELLHRARAWQSAGDHCRAASQIGAFLELPLALRTTRATSTQAYERRRRLCDQFPARFDGGPPDCIDTCCAQEGSATSAVQILPPADWLAVWEHFHAWASSASPSLRHPARAWPWQRSQLAVPQDQSGLDVKVLSQSFIPSSFTRPSLALLANRSRSGTRFDRALKNLIGPSRDALFLSMRAGSWPRLHFTHLDWIN